MLLPPSNPLRPKLQHSLPALLLRILALLLRIPALLLCFAALAAAASAQGPPPPSAPHRTRLILKDGSYQVVMGYRIVGANVLYVSAERGGVEEVIPARLVDLDATRQWQQRHPTVDPDAPHPVTPAPVIDPELLKEEADRAAYTPEVAPDLSLPELDSVLALDTFHSTPELIPMPQASGELNRNTAHNILPGAINPLAASHTVVQLKGVRSPVQLHVTDPVFYVRVGDGPPSGTGTALTVDTHGTTANAPTASAGGSATSRSGGHGGRGAHAQLGFESLDQLGGFQQGQPADLFN